MMAFSLLQLGASMKLYRLVLLALYFSLGYHAHPLNVLAKDQPGRQSKVTGLC